MVRKSIYLLIVMLVIVFMGSPSVHAELHAGASAGREKAEALAAARFDLNHWLVPAERPGWSDRDQETLERVMRNTLGALRAFGLDGAALLDGYRFRYWPGTFAKDREGKIAIINHADLEIVLSDTTLLPEYEFFLYHEIGHAVNRRSGGLLNDMFHGLIAEIDGISIKHEWSTAEGFWMRGQTYNHRSEAVADAFALWVLSGHVGLPFPVFHDTPETARPEDILQVFDQAMEETFSSP